MVKAPVCGTGDRRFESDYPPHFLNLQDISLADLRLLRYNFKKVNIGVSSSGKTQHFDCCIRRFKSCHPSHKSASIFYACRFYFLPFTFLADVPPLKWRWASLRQAGGICRPCKGRWVAVRQLGGISLKKQILNKKYFGFLIPQSVRIAHSQLPLQGSLYCHFATFPTPWGESPFLGEPNSIPQSPVVTAPDGMSPICHLFLYKTSSGFLPFSS